MRLAAITRVVVEEPIRAIGTPIIHIIPKQVVS
jgi:hypothetical protein